LFSYLGSAYLTNQKPREAIDALERSVAIDASDSRVLYTLGTLLAKEGDYARAAQFLQRIPDQDADDAAYFNLGLAYARSGQFDRARRAYFRAIDKENGNTEAYCQIGLDFASAGEARKAIPWLFRAREFVGDRPDIDYALIEELLQLKYFETAEEVVKAGLEKNRNEPLLLAASGDIARQRNQFPQAASRYHDALREKPGLVPAYAGLAQIAVAEGKTEQARGYLMDALRAEPDNAVANGQIGMLDAREGRWDAALSVLSKAWEKDKSRPLIGLELARALRHNGRTADAVTVMDSLAIRLHESGAFHSELAQLYMQLHQIAKAQAERELTASLEAKNRRELHFEDPQTYVH
jgi:predicted Zn-dependent protease